MSYLRNICSVFFIIAFLSTNALAKDDEGLHFEKIPIANFVDAVSAYTGTNIVYSPDMLKGNVTIKVHKSFSKQDMLDVLNTVLKMHNLNLITKDGANYVVSTRNIRKFSPSYAKQGKLANNGFSVIVLQIEAFDQRAISGLLNIMKSNIGSYVLIPRIKTIIVKDRGENLKSIAHLIEHLNKSKNSVQIKIFTLKYTDVSQIATSLRNFLVGLNRLTYEKTMPVFMEDRDSNALIVAATPEDITIVKNIISKMDVANKKAAHPQVFNIKYAKADDVMRVINRLLPALQSNRKKSGSVIRIAADKATNTISVAGDPKLYDKVKSLIEKLDVPRNQIFVKALIIETTLDKASKFGVEWLAGAGGHNVAGAATFTNSGNMGALSSPVLEGKSPNFSALPGGFSLGIMGNVITYEGVKFPTLSSLVNAIKSKSGIKILSEPQLLTLDNKKANVFVGQNRPFLISKKFDSNNNPIQTYDYRDVGIKLNVLPHIIDKDTLLLNIKEDVKKVVATAGTVSAPITLTRNTNTTVKVKDGMTVVISGLIKNDNSIKETKVPILSAIPLLGNLFTFKSKESEKTDMMVFITTRIISTKDAIKRLTEEKKKEAGYHREKNKIDNKTSTTRKDDKSKK